MWRILKVGGVFVLVSTMPPEVIEPLALTPLLAPRNQTENSASDWKRGCRVLPLTTQEGGNVFYYAIRKLGEISRVTSFRPSAPPSSASTSSSHATKVGAAADNSGIMAGIAALLEEAKRAKENMEAAAKQVQPVHMTS